MTPPSFTPPSFTLRRRGLDLKFRTATLAERTWETDAYVRVRLCGPELIGFTSPGSDDHMRLFFPHGPVGSIDEIRAALSREYTPLAWAGDWLDVEFNVDPGDRGVAAEWAASAPIGATIGVGGPRGSLLIDGAPDAWFLAAMKPAAPALRRFAASMPDDSIGRILVEVLDAAHELAIAAPDGVHVEHLHRGAAPGGEVLSARLDALTTPDRPHGDVFAFIAAEQSIVRAGGRSPSSAGDWTPTESASRATGNAAKTPSTPHTDQIAPQVDPRAGRCWVRRECTEFAIQAISIRGSTRKGVPFAEVDIRQNDAARDYVIEDLGCTEAPVVVVSDEDHWSGLRP